MGVFHIFNKVQMVPDRAKCHLYLVKTNTKNLNTKMENVLPKVALCHFTSHYLLSRFVIVYVDFFSILIIQLYIIFYVLFKTGYLTAQQMRLISKYTKHINKNVEKLRLMR